MNEPLHIANAGQRIVSTNYWDSELERAGYVYLSWNAGAARLLLPDSLKSAIREMKSADYVIISRGPWDAMGGQEGLELLFEDNTDEPYCLHIAAAQTDRTLPARDEGGGFFVTVWTRGGEKLRLPGRYRRVEAIPCLEPWTSGAAAAKTAVSSEPPNAEPLSTSWTYGSQSIELDVEYLSWPAPGPTFDPVRSVNTLASDFLEAQRCATELCSRYGRLDVKRNLRAGIEPWPKHADDQFDLDIRTAFLSLAGRFSAIEVVKMIWVLAEQLDHPDNPVMLILELPEELNSALADEVGVEERCLVYPSGVDDEGLVAKVSALSVIERAALVHALVRINQDRRPSSCMTEDYFRNVGLVLSDESGN